MSSYLDIGLVNIPCVAKGSRIAIHCRSKVRARLLIPRKAADLFQLLGYQRFPIEKHGQNSLSWKHRSAVAKLFIFKNKIK